MRSSIVELFKEYALERINCYAMTKANLPVRAELANACEHLEKLIKNDGWTSVEDDLPDNDKEDYLVYSIHTKVYEKVSLPQLKQMIANSAKITHWRLLPATPEE